MERERERVRERTRRLETKRAGGYLSIELSLEQGAVLVAHAAFLQLAVFEEPNHLGREKERQEERKRDREKESEPGKVSRGVAYAKEDSGVQLTSRRRSLA